MRSVSASATEGQREEEGLTHEAQPAQSAAVRLALLAEGALGVEKPAQEANRLTRQSASTRAQGRAADALVDERRGRVLGEVRV